MAWYFVKHRDNFTCDAMVLVLLSLELPHGKCSNGCSANVATHMLLVIVTIM